MNHDVMMKERVHAVHFLGMGGVGMAGIAEVMIHQGYRVSGSDLGENTWTQRLAKLGARVFVGHHASQVLGADVVVVSSAVPDDNVELLAAQAAGIPVVLRAQMLAELMRNHRGLAVAGTHGKTTTTSLTATLFHQAKLDPTYVIGGKLNQHDHNAYHGTGGYFIVEADESDASFLFLNPMISVVTNIDTDHLSTYGGDFEVLKRAFLQFLDHLPFYGLAVMCWDCPVVREIAEQLERPVRRYGFHEDADVRALNYRQEGYTSFFHVCALPYGLDFDVELKLPGEHNAQNALAAIACALEAGIDVAVIQQALAGFSGVGRRFQSHGEFCWDGGQAWLVEDYGHHAKELEVTLTTARLGWPQRRVVFVFQPHRYTRTAALFNDFVQVLQTADVLIILDVYAAGEAPIPGAGAKDLAHAVASHGVSQSVYLKDRSDLPSVLAEHLQNDDLVILSGAGSIHQSVADIQAYFQ